MASRSSIREGETFALVGESGCGKTTLGRSIVRLQEPTGGRVLFQGTDIRTLSGQPLKAVRRDIQMIFQDPHSSLNPRMRVVDIVGEGLSVQGGWRREREEKVAELLASSACARITCTGIRTSSAGASDSASASRGR